MRVMILGAGASKPAGYPLASELFDDLVHVARRTPFSQLRDAWQRWEESRESLPSQLRLAVFNSNPEVVLTLVDLCVAAIEAEDLRRTSSAVRTYTETGEGNATTLEVYFKSLADFDFHLNRNRIRLVDSAEPKSFRDDPSLIGYPSFMKQLDHPIVDQIWRNASEAMARAESVEVWGYSLPPSDGAIRALLQGVSARARRGELNVVVHDPSRSVLARWKALLGERIDVRREKL